MAFVLALCAVASVICWHATQSTGEGDLRPYLIFQALPIVLIPLWQISYGAPRAERFAFGAAIALYALAKAVELYDRPVFASLRWISGHTLKHLLATAAAATIVAYLVRSVDAGRVTTATRRRYRHIVKLWRLGTDARAPGNPH